MLKLMSTGIRWSWIAILVVAFDRFSKIGALTYLNFQEPVRILPFFDLTLTYNTGAAFSFLHNASGWQNLFFTTLALTISVFIIAWLIRLPSKSIWVSIALCLILGGALGNTWDRIAYQYVIDYFAFHLNDWHFAIFNVADSAICLGAFMLMWDWLFQTKEKARI